MWGKTGGEQRRKTGNRNGRGKYRRQKRKPNKEGTNGKLKKKNKATPLRRPLYRIPERASQDFLYKIVLTRRSLETFLELQTKLCCPLQCSLRTPQKLLAKFLHVSFHNTTTTSSLVCLSAGSNASTGRLVHMSATDLLHNHSQRSSNIFEVLHHLVSSMKENSVISLWHTNKSSPFFRAPFFKKFLFFLFCGSTPSRPLPKNQPLQVWFPLL